MPHFPAEVLCRYPDDCRPAAEPTAIRDGFSGSQVWRIDSPRGPLCLRRWSPEHPQPAYLCYIHDVLDRAAAAGRPVPVAIRTDDGQTFVEHDGRLWELTPWLSGIPMSGPADDSPLSLARLEAAMTALAQFHVATGDVPLPRPLGVSACDVALPPGISKRRLQLSDLRHGGIDRLTAIVRNRTQLWPELANSSARLLDLFQRSADHVQSLLDGVATLQVPLQPCIRDIYREHVLFEGAHVTGIIDFGAMRPDNVACDIARLLGSLALARRLWQTGLDAYQQVRPLSADEQRLITAYDQSAVLLSGVNWLCWVFIEKRTFEDRPGVLARFEEITARLAHLAGPQKSPNRMIV